MRLRPGEAESEVAWTEFYRIYSPLISGFARRLGATADAAEEAVQEVLSGFFAVSPRFEYDPSKGTFRGYLKVCTVRVLAKLHAKQRLVVGRPLLQMADDAPEVVRAWDDQWDQERLDRALREVREHYAANAQMACTFRAFELVVIFGMSSENVAAELNVSVESVYAAKSRISKALRKSMDSMNDTLR